MRRCYIEGTIWDRDDPNSIPRQEVYLCSEADGTISNLEKCIEKFMGVYKTQTAAITARDEEIARLKALLGESDEESEIKQDELYIDHWPDYHTAQIDLRYPRLSHYKFIQIGLSDIRATNDIRVSFDFEHSGWKVERPIYREDQDGNQTQEWQEVAIVYDYEEGEPTAQENITIPQT